MANCPNLRPSHTAFCSLISNTIRLSSGSHELSAGTPRPLNELKPAALTTFTNASWRAAFSAGGSAIDLGFHALMSARRSRLMGFQQPSEATSTLANPDRDWSAVAVDDEGRIG